MGFSGGADSVTLLYILHLSGYECVAAHCNFHLRSDESERDELFCRNFTAQHHIKYEQIDFDTRSYADRQRISIEMAARELRYEWFETLRKKYDAQAIAVAHHRDDGNETVLLNLIRGTGIRGLCGIRLRNGWIVRPLLCVGKEDINRFIDERQLPFVTDSSNFSDEYTRNFIRLRLIPLMKEVNPSVDEALARTASHAVDIENIYLHVIENARKLLLKKIEDDIFFISINELSNQISPRTILYELLKPFGFTRFLSYDIYNSLSGESGKVFDAPNSDFRLDKDRNSLFIYKKPSPTTEIYLISENNMDFNQLPIRLSMQKIIVNADFVIDRSPSTATFDYEKVPFPLVLRKWRNGDWFIPFGMRGRKKISDYFTDHKFSLIKKNNTWLLCSGDYILWIVGERMDNRFRIEKHSKYAVEIIFLSK